jgi:hypothetical protein
MLAHVILIAAATMAANPGAKMNPSPDDLTKMHAACAHDTSNRDACESNVYWYLHRNYTDIPAVLPKKWPPK